MGGHQGRPDVRGRQGSGPEEVVDGCGRGACEVVGVSGRDGDRLQHVRLRRGRPTTVVNAEAGRHHDEQWPDVPEAQLDAKVVRVVGRIPEQRRQRPEVGGVVDHCDLHTFTVEIDRVCGVLERGSDVRRGRLVGDEGVLG